ncbi:peptidylprolyl isomerase [Pseudidiomarina homiensis]|uniref:Peptidyl-prolyl cis-trans isomerase n=1 Tax=Pseudidiomarina homiensis TaxID=364198 RepID=A0A432Y5F6_9GAMM|nr:peptidylprolyl isomerase [Pseudidiomarina homiensis]RUO56121.1 peptidylprolyl isomerase [Pseudidiomarina homiensis]
MHVTLHTNHGAIKLELYSEQAPKTVENFLRYVREGFYAETLFHRVIKGFMIQGGGFNLEMVQKSTHDAIENEADNGLKNLKGTVAMARTQDPHSATSQFFINVADNEFLNFKNESVGGWGYCVFGKVVEGMDVVDKIEQVYTTQAGFHQDVPKDDVIIEKATVEGE